MLKELIKINNEYKNIKHQAVEKTVNTLESKTKLFLVVLFAFLLMFIWLFTIFAPIGLDELYNEAEFYPFILFFIISYFTFFLGSKIIVKPSQEELSDDTSIFALFSACGRKEMRSFISAGLSVLQTIVFILYLMNKDLGIL